MLGEAKHQRGTGLGTAEDEQLSWRHFHSDSLGFSTVVDQRKEGQPLGLQNILEPVNGFIDRMTTRLVDDSFCGSHRDPRNPAA